MATPPSGVLGIVLILLAVSVSYHTGAIQKLIRHIKMHLKHWRTFQKASRDARFSVKQGIEILWSSAKTFVV